MTRAARPPGGACHCHRQAGDLRHHRLGCPSAATHRLCGAGLAPSRLHHRNCRPEAAPVLRRILEAPLRPEVHVHSREVAALSACRGARRTRLVERTSKARGQAVHGQALAAARVRRAMMGARMEKATAKAHCADGRCPELLSLRDRQNFPKWGAHSQIYFRADATDKTVSFLHPH